MVLENNPFRERDNFIRLCKLKTYDCIYRISTDSKSQPWLFPYHVLKGPVIIYHLGDQKDLGLNTVKFS